ncbi:MAG: Flp pilus assembly complex ATPase component TadA [Phycisphaeraceae bacterium]|nr:Flp pilus assembly complex ATPase component TadA [Phycisphaeraceae bacterium]
MLDRYTDSYHQVMSQAADEARRWQHEYLGTEHLLLVLADNLCTAGQVLRNLGVDPQKIRHAVETRIQRGPDKVAPGKLPPAPNAHQAIGLAVEESRQAKAFAVGTEHLLLGMLRASDSLAANVLAELGITLDAVRAEIPKTLKTSSPASNGPLDPEVMKFWRSLLEQAQQARASDIHLNPLEGGRGRVRFRIDGALRDVGEPLSADVFRSAVDHLKAMSGMDVSQRKSPQDGRIHLTVDGRPLQLFVCVLPAYHGPSAVVRILRPDAALLPLDGLGLSDHDLAAVQSLCRLPKGLVIVTGPTGCGKTTLLYGMLHHAYQPQISVMTVEDPVECTIDGIVHVPVDPTAGMLFPRVIRSMLRQDPDVIMVGEIRDLETLQLCAQCSLTGHLVMTTLHTDSAVSALERMRDIGLPPFLINGTLAGVIAMRLVRVLCPHCRQPIDPPLSLLPSEAKEIIKNLPAAQFYTAKGCPQCINMGYRGRTGIFEILLMDDAIRRLVDQNADTTQLLAAARQVGMKTLFHDGLIKAARGLTTLEEVLWVGLGMR